MVSIAKMKLPLLATTAGLTLATTGALATPIGEEPSARVYGLAGGPGLINHVSSGPEGAPNDPAKSYFDYLVQAGHQRMSEPQVDTIATPSDTPGQ